MHLFWYSWAWLGFFQLALLALPFDVVLRIARRPVGSRRPFRAVTIVRTTRAAARAFPWPVECLPQSLCNLAMLRRGGLFTEMRIGISTEPFRAHAWVVHEGRPVEEPDLSMYQVHFRSEGMS